MDSQLIQEPSPGQHLLMFRGDVVTFKLSLNDPLNGNAFLRTNIGRATVSRQEIIQSVEKDKPILSKDWFDIPMKKTNANTFRVTIPLTEPGHFQAKCF